MISPARIRVLFLGCGAAARIHSRVLRSFPDVELAYASSSTDRALAMCKEFGGVGAWGSYEDALDDPTVNFVVVATPTSTHQALAMQALRAGKHVLIEKPAFLSARDANTVRALAGTEKRHVFVAENYIYKPMATRLRALITDGMLGDVRFVSLNATRWQPPSGWRAVPALSGGGALFEAGVHWIGFAARIGLNAISAQGFAVGARCVGKHHVAEQRVAERSVVAQRSVALRDVGEQNVADKSSLVVIRYANGAVATLAHSWELRGTLRGARLSKVQGTAGSFTFESNGFASLTTGRKTAVETYFRDALGYRAMHLNFLGVLRDECEPLYSFEMAQRDLELLEMAQRGLDNGAAA